MSARRTEGLTGVKFAPTPDGLSQILAALYADVRQASSTGCHVWGEGFGQTLVCCHDRE